MKSFEDIAAEFHISALHAEELASELQQLQQQFDPEQLQALYPKFENIVNSFGISDEQIEYFVEMLYVDPQFSRLVTFLVPSFYHIGGDRMMFETIYEQMMSDLEAELD